MPDVQERLTGPVLNQFVRGETPRDVANCDACSLDAFADSTPACATRLLTVGERLVYS